MTRHRICGTVVAACLIAGPVVAAEDLRVSSGGSAADYRGIGAKARLIVPLDRQRYVSAAKRVTLEFSAGPTMLRSGTRSGNVSVDVSPAVSFRIRPRYSATLKMGGIDLATRYTRSALAERQSRETGTGNRNGVSTLGWVGIGAGALVGAIVIAGAIVFHCPSSQECGSD